MSNILPVEAEIVAIAKRVLAENDAQYCRKFTQVLKKNGQPTGKRSHKFWGVRCPTKHISQLAYLIDEAIKTVTQEYEAEAVYTWPSISIRPIR
jgi:hypothetical protein